MNIEALRSFCLSLPHVTEDIKWGNDLCFLIGEKMFCATNASGNPMRVSMKTSIEDFDRLTETDAIIPAPYLARYKWILVESPDRFTQNEWEHFITRSYEMVKGKLPKKVLNSLGQ